ncbi:Deleted in malignant brain tumors 1 protein [Holothuria leucospilota]|uniref:Deleted in malignant brain tumors 1 protein n=1 Tax=Holothuria leucospilota TaxID=206669 RepID=A0A9Q0YPC8_HOLLE|nr:Deleted in malignant brain tumors 1 protein [Holothuria leucospilota]
MAARFCQRFGSFFLAWIVVFKLAIFTTSMGRAALDDGEIRFIEGNETAGKVEAFLDGKWLTLCDDFWEFNNALVVCQQRGFKGSYDVIHGTMELQRTGVFVDLLCEGVEQTILDCSYSLVHYCRYEDAVVSCTPYDHGDVRIAGANSTSGLVEVYFQMRWIAFCSDGWDLTDADVLCRQLGLIEAVSTFEDTETESDMFSLSQVDCFGNEEGLLDCAFTTSQDCQTNSYASVACKAPENGMVRLVGGSDIFSGRLEIFLKGEWGSVCDDDWDLTDANVVCRQPGYGNAIRHTVGSFPFGAGTGPILTCCLDCHGNENDLESCARSADYICDHTEDAGVICELSNCKVTRDFPVRLMGAIGTPYSGRVEVLVEGQWGTICDDEWDINDANVVCRQLGFGIAVDAKTHASFGQGTGPIVFSQLDCNGTEMNLWDCPVHLGIGSGNIDCEHTQDAGVICSATLDDGEIRFSEGNATAGKVEVFLDGKWLTFCDDFWEFNNALVVCQQRGFKGSYGTILGDMELQRTGVFVKLLCEGVEQTILDCDYSLVDECTYEDAVVSCRTYGKLQAANHGDARIAGANSTSGLVEVYFEMRWIAVCSDGWDLTDADVFCRQLGLMEADSTFEFTETESDMFSLSQVDCFGNEEKLLDCGYTTPRGCQTNSYSSVACKAPATENGMVRLVGGSDMFSGRLEIFLKGEWGSVCDDDWDLTDANVVCRQLGYGNAIRHTVGSFPFGAGTGPILSCCLDCHGNEDDLVSCARSADILCYHTEDAGVICEPITRDFPVRLMGAIGTPYSGRVEVLVEGQWGTICDDEWDINDANVVCQQLGFGIAVDAKTHASFGQGTGPIVFTQLDCKGTEMNL